MVKHNLVSESNDDWAGSNSSPKRARLGEGGSSLPPSSPPQASTSRPRGSAANGRAGGASGVNGTNQEGNEDSEGSDELEDAEDDEEEQERQRGELERMERETQAVGVSTSLASACYPRELGGR